MLNTLFNSVSITVILSGFTLFAVSLNVKPIIVKIIPANTILGIVV